MDRATDPRSLLTPPMRAVLDGMARSRRPPLYTLAPEQARAAYERGAGVLEVPAPPTARVEDFTIPTRDGHALPARLYAPGGMQAPPLLAWFHGGGFVIGSVASYDTLCRVLSSLGQCAVVSVDYRLAPEHRFPTAVNDAWDALCWLAEHGGRLGVDSSRIAVGGDSAGGTLATVCATLARDAALPLALQLLFYPGCAAHPTSASQQRFAEGFLLDQALVRYFFGHYLESPAQREDWRFAPLETPDLQGVAPVWLALAECDPLVDDGLAYADRLRFAGVPVQLEIHRGVVHDFIKMGRTLPEARQAHADAGQALRTCFSIPATP